MQLKPSVSQTELNTYHAPWSFLKPILPPIRPISFSSRDSYVNGRDPGLLCPVHSTSLASPFSPTTLIALVQAFYVWILATDFYVISQTYL